ncbi:MAG: phosphodiesterase, partial [Halomonas sp.]|nr:phosphodiesterase [Halomonas sp.]
LLVSATLLCMGATSLLVGLVLPQVVLGPMLVPDAALATLLIGVSLLATLCQWRVLRLASAGGLTLLLLYTLLHNLMAQGVSESWVTGQPRMTSLTAAVLLVANVCLWRGVEGVARQRWWRAAGIGLLLFGGVVVLQLWRPQANQATLFTSSPLAVLVFIVLLGAAL